MYFGFTAFITEHVTEQSRLIDKIFDYLKISLQNREYGDEVTKAIFAYSCGCPLSSFWEDSETGIVSKIKYTRSKQMLEVTFRLSYNEIIRATNEEDLIQITERGIINTYEAVKALGIKNFDIDKFYKDLKELLSTRYWLKSSEKYKVFFSYKHEPTTNDSVSQRDKMPEDEFWQLIEQSNDASDKDIIKQVEVIINLLSDKKEATIIGFEYRLRELLKKSYHYNVTALLYIIQGSVTDDSLLYFRCMLILSGKAIFETVVVKPIKLTKRIYPNDAAELLLTVADKAFIKKLGEDTDKELPRDVAASFLNYDEADYKLAGIRWDNKNFEKLYAPLIKLYRK